MAILSIEWCPCLYQGNVGHPGVKWSAPKAEERGETPNQHSAVHQPANQLLIIILSDQAGCANWIPVSSVIRREVGRIGK